MRVNLCLPFPLQHVADLAKFSRKARLPQRRVPLHAPRESSTRALSSIDRASSRPHAAVIGPVEHAIVLVFTLFYFHLRHLASRTRPAATYPHLALVDLGE